LETAGWVLPRVRTKVWMMADVKVGSKDYWVWRMVGKRAVKMAE
jgi:hypothetical protein